jgi:DNA-binding NtrC family response regulator
MKTIIYIDHSESYRSLLQEELSEEGYQVVTANNIEGALSELRGVNPDLVILELRQKRFREEGFEKLKNQYPGIPWVGYSTFFQCPDEFKKWINFYLPKSSKLVQMAISGSREYGAEEGGAKIAGSPLYQPSM